VRRRIVEIERERLGEEGGGGGRVRIKGGMRGEKKE
jgi:hypothetical protein